MKIPEGQSRPAVTLSGPHPEGSVGKSARALFGVHTWVAVKATDAPAWTVYEVIGWRLRWADSAVVVRNREPDARWFGADPELYAEKRGAGVDELIRRIDKAVREYPYAKQYTIWPGPNSPRSPPLRPDGHWECFDASCAKSAPPSMSFLSFSHSACVFFLGLLL